MKRIPAFFLHVEQNFGSRQMVATTGYKNDDGELLNYTDSNRWDGDYQYADFQVRAYLGGYSGGEPDMIWGRGFEYKPFRVELAQAEVMVKLLRKLAKGMDVAERESGYLAEADYAGYLFRIAKIIGVGEYYVRNSDQVIRTNREVYRKVTVTGVQDWIMTRQQELRGVPVNN